MSTSTNTFLLPSASIAPIVRLKYLLGLNDAARFLQGLGLILAWAQAEVGIGLLVANLPACRPLLESAIAAFASSIGSGNKSAKTGATSAAGKNSYLELGERDPNAASRKGHSMASRGGVETQVYGTYGADGSSESLPPPADSRERIVHKQSQGQIHVQTEFGMEYENKQRGNSHQGPTGGGY